MITIRIGNHIATIYLYNNGLDEAAINKYLSGREIIPVNWTDYHAALIITFREDDCTGNVTIPAGAIRYTTYEVVDANHLAT